MRHVLPILTLILLAGPAVAQSLDELPPDVAAVSKDAVAACRKIGGTPDYEPLDLVKLVNFGKSEAYLIDTRALRCKDGKNARKDGRLHCRDDHCKIIVMVPASGDRFNIAYRNLVERWSAAGDGLDVTINNQTIRLTLRNGGLAEK